MFKRDEREAEIREKQHHSTGDSIELKIDHHVLAKTENNLNLPL